jgi:hypothetical protein
VRRAIVGAVHPDRERAAMDAFDLKIFGERNTSTNALRQILERNSASRVFPSIAADIDPGLERRVGRLRRLSRLIGPFRPDWFAHAREAAIDRVFDGVPPTHAWKHGATRFDSAAPFDGVCVVFCVRNPYSWLQSLFKNPYHVTGARPARFADFIDMDWPLVRRDALPVDRLTPLDLYHEKLRSYLDFIDQLAVRGIAHHVIRFEDIVTDQAAVFARLAPDLRDPADTFTMLEKSTKDSRKDAAYYREYYRDETWRQGIEPEIALLEGRVDKPLFARFGYSL